MKEKGWASIDNKKLILKTKSWLEYEGQPLIGEGRCLLLEKIGETHSLEKAARHVGICKKTAYNYVRSIEKRINEKVVFTEKGGRAGGARMGLTKTGEKLIETFREKKR